MKKILTIILLTMVAIGTLSAQNYNKEKNNWVNYVIRLYDNSPFEGVKVVDDNQNKYLICVVALSLEKYPDESVRNRVADVRSQASANRFFNGSDINANIIIRTTEDASGNQDTDVIETIRENSTGLVKAMEQLTNFESKGKQVYIYSAPIPEKKTKKSKK